MSLCVAHCLSETCCHWDRTERRLISCFLTFCFLSLTPGLLCVCARVCMLSWLQALPLALHLTQQHRCLCSVLMHSHTLFAVGYREGKMRSDIAHLYWMGPLITHGIIVTAFNTKRWFSAYNSSIWQTSSTRAGPVWDHMEKWTILAKFRYLNVTIFQYDY